jgi:hypothetical protein
VGVAAADEVEEQLRLALAQPHDPRYIVLTLDFDTTEHATAFLRFLETQVWTSAAAAPALAGPRRTAILEPEPAAVI